MIQVQDTIISDDIFEECFICDLCKCKGQCCVDGESGAPLLQEEFEQIQHILPQIWDDLSDKAKEIIEKQGIAYTDYAAVNYHRWSVCNPAVKLGKKEGVKIYQFLKEPLIRRFGKEWYDEVCEVAQYLKNKE